MKPLIPLILLTILVSACTDADTIGQPADNQTIDETVGPGIVPPDPNGSTTSVDTSNGTSGPAPPSPRQWTDGLDSCTSDSECIIVRSGYCGGAHAINAENEDAWNAILAEDDEEGRASRRQCEPTLPLWSFRAECRTGMCLAVQAS